MSSTVLAAQVRVKTWMDGAADRLKRSEAGQGSAEYAGVIVVAVALVGLLVAGATDWADTIKTGISDQLGKLFGS